MYTYPSFFPNISEGAICGWGLQYLPGPHSTISMSIGGGLKVFVFQGPFKKHSFILIDASVVGGGVGFVDALGPQEHVLKVIGS